MKETSKQKEEKEQLLKDSKQLKEAASQLKTDLIKDDINFQQANPFIRYARHYRPYLSDWRLYFKIVLAIVIAFGLLWFLIDGLLNIKVASYWDPKGKDDWWEIHLTGKNGEGNIVEYDYSGYVAWYFSYFTYQSNILILGWLLIVIFWPWHEGKGWLGSLSQLLIATYISITTLIFWCMLIPSNAVNGTLKTYTAMTWFCDVLLHLVSGVSFVLYVSLWSTKFKTYKTKRWFTNLAWSTLIYPAVYCAAILIREECLIHSGADANTWYPYFFFDIHNRVNGMMGWIWLIIAIIAIVIIAYAFSTLYAFTIDRVKNKEFTKIPERLLEKELIK